MKRTIDKKISLQIENNADNHIVIGDGSELQSAILNLGINASHAMPDGGQIYIITNNISLDEEYCESVPFDVSPGEFIQVEVRDEGSGIKPENISRIFEPFFSTKDQGKGTGLGLATVYGAILDHHGVINVDSDLASGTSFFMLLPCSSETPETNNSDTKVLKGSGRIRLVDDEEIIRHSGQGILEDMGYTVLLAENGKIAVDMYRDDFEEIDLVLMDVIMPEMNGTEAFYKMKEINPECKIIMTSGFTKNEDINKLKDAGLSDFIKKPFIDVDLFKVIERVLNK